MQRLIAIIFLITSTVSSQELMVDGCTVISEDAYYDHIYFGSCGSMILENNVTLTADYVSGEGVVRIRRKTYDEPSVFIVTGCVENGYSSLDVEDYIDYTVENDCVLSISDITQEEYDRYRSLSYVDVYDVLGKKLNREPIQLKDIDVLNIKPSTVHLVKFLSPVFESFLRLQQ